MVTCPIFDAHVSLPVCPTHDLLIATQPEFLRKNGVLLIELEGETEDEMNERVARWKPGGKVEGRERT